MPNNSLAANVPISISVEGLLTELPECRSPVITSPTTVTVISNIRGEWSVGKTIESENSPCTLHREPSYEGKCVTYGYSKTVNDRSMTEVRGTCENGGTVNVCTSAKSCVKITIQERELWNYVKNKVGFFASTVISSQYTWFENFNVHKVWELFGGIGSCVGSLALCLVGAFFIGNNPLLGILFFVLAYAVAGADALNPAFDVVPPGDLSEVGGTIRSIIYVTALMIHLYNLLVSWFGMLVIFYATNMQCAIAWTMHVCMANYLWKSAQAMRKCGLTRTDIGRAIITLSGTVGNTRIALSALLIWTAPNLNNKRRRRRRDRRRRIRPTCSRCQV